MAGFKLVKENTDPIYKKLRIASQAYTIGDLGMLDRTSDSVDVVPATSSTTTTGVYAVAMETVTSSATEALFCLVNPEQVWEVDSTNNSSESHNYQRMLLTDKDSVNNTGTDNTTKEAVFMQTGTVGAVSAKKIVGNILKVANVTA
jgi:hypothetical protein